MHEVSPSQITNARRCLRRWNFESRLGLRPPTAAGAAFGSEVHNALEYRLRHGEWDPHETLAVLSRAEPAFDALCAFLGVHDLRDADSDPGVEIDWRLEDTYSLAARGRADLVLPNQNTVVDWKTTSNFQYVKTDEERELDPQVLCYVDAFVKLGVLQLPADFLHVWTVTKGKPSAVVTRTVVTEESLSIGRKALAKTIDVLAEIDRSNPDPLDVPPNPLACNDFHQTCFHYDRCFPKRESKPEVESMSIKAQIEARKAELAARQADTFAPAVNPPDAPAEETYNAPEEPKPSKRTPGVIAAFAKMLAENPDEALTAPLPEPEAEAPKKRGRPAKAQPVMESLPEVYAPERLTIVPMSNGCVPREATGRPGHTLLIGAFPLRGGDGWTLADEWLAGFAQTACENLRVAYWGLADFGKGKQAVVALVDAACKRGEIPPKLILDRRSALADAVAEILLPYYDDVFVKVG